MAIKSHSRFGTKHNRNNNRKKAHSKPSQNTMTVVFGNAEELQ